MMEKKIKRLLCLLRMEFALMWVMNAGLVTLYETDILPQGVFVDDVQMEYVMQTVGILLAVCLIPLSLRVFHFSLTRYVRQLSLPAALVSYRRWNEVRLSMLLAPSLFNMTVYYTTLNVKGLLCTGMVLLASLFCVPGRKRLLKELDLENEETDNRRLA